MIFNFVRIFPNDWFYPSQEKMKDIARHDASEEIKRIILNTCSVTSVKNEGAFTKVEVAIDTHKLDDAYGGKEPND